MADQVAETLKLTPFRYANVPPPMSFTEVTLPHNIVDFSVSETEDDDSTTMIAVLTSIGVTVYTWAFQNNKPGIFTKIGELRIFDEDQCKWDVDVSRLIFQQISCSAQQKRLWIMCSDSVGASSIMTYQLEPDIQCVALHVESDHVKLFVRIISSAGSPPYLLSLGSQVRAVYNAHEASHNHKILLFPRPVSKCVGIKLPSRTLLTNGDHPNGASRLDESMFFGQTAGGSLYANQRLLLQDCTSFLVTPAHLIFTTTKNLLKFVHLTDIESKLRSLFRRLG